MATMFFTFPTKKLPILIVTALMVLLPHANPSAQTVQDSVSISGAVQSRTTVSSPGSPGQGSVSISGAEQSTTITEDSGAECTIRPPRCPPPITTTIYDSGTVTITVNGWFSKSVGFSQNSTTSTIATALRAAINNDGARQVDATGTGATITLRARSSGASTNYALSTSFSWDNSNFANPSFTSTPSGSTLTGGANEVSTTIFDSGTVSITANAVTKTVSYGQGDDAASVANKLAQAFNSDCNSPLFAATWLEEPAAFVEFRLKQANAQSGYTLSAASATTQGTFSQASFATSIRTAPASNEYSLSLPSSAIIGSNCERQNAWQALSPSQQDAVKEQFRNQVSASVQTKWQQTKTSRNTSFGLYSESTSFPVLHNLVNVTSDSISAAKLTADSSGSVVTSRPLGSQTASSPSQGLIMASPTIGVAPLTVNFNARAPLQSPLDPQCRFSDWDFGDGQTDSSSGAIATHVYQSGGTFVATAHFVPLGLTGTCSTKNSNADLRVSIQINVGPPQPDDDGDGLSEAFENQLADLFTPFYHVSNGERSGTGFATFRNSTPQTVQQVFAAVPPISHVRVNKLGFTSFAGQQLGVLQIDYLTLWNRDDGLDLGFICESSITFCMGLIGFAASEIFDGASSHNLDNERAAVLVAAPTPSFNTFNTDALAYGAYSYFLAAHEDTIFDHSVYIDADPAAPVPPGNHLKVWLSRSKHGTYHFNPKGLPLVPSPLIVATYATIDSLFFNGQIDALTYSEFLFLADTAFFACVTEKFSDQGGRFASTRINVGELNHPINSSGFILDSALAAKLRKAIFRLR